MSLQANITFARIPATSASGKEILKAAKHDSFIGDVLKERAVGMITGFFINSLIVGFAIPRTAGPGIYRTGPIFVLPNYRSKGIAQKYVKEFFSDKNGLVYIEDNNHPSVALFTKCGFVKQDKSINDGNVTLHQYKYTKE